jgi:putative cardiolipin synthase
LFLISPYFVPGKPGTALLSELVSRGVAVTVLTNSLAATDVPAVHGGYARYRQALLNAGVKLYEMRPSAQMDDGEGRRFGHSQASLHAKSIVIDRQQVLVGSMNLDPRSALLNTEMGIVIESPPLAESVIAWRDQSMSTLAWRVEQESVQGVYGENDELVWVETRDGQEHRLASREPEAGIWARLQAVIARLLPIEQQL